MKTEDKLSNSSESKDIKKGGDGEAEMNDVLQLKNEEVEIRHDDGYSCHDKSRDFNHQIP